ncbi:MAG: TonB-dependent receptor [Chloroherpetonaceae bacterium]|nr:TonB-dependent receptor [Chloroherpetonaceae bacterium]
MLKVFTHGWRFAIAVTFLGFSICSFSYPVFAQEYGTISGKVTDAKFGEPLPFVRIQVVDSKLGTVSQTDGRYSFRVPPGEYTLRVSSIGYAPQIAKVKVGAGETVVKDFVLVETFVQAQELVVTGTRRSDRTVTESPAPIDIITAKEIRQMGQVETNQILQFLVPSYNFPRPSITDGTDHVRPATLRGMGPDQVLVLLNGKRRHTSALVNVNGSIGRGAAAVDLNAIPASAIERIEILRDGAAAQYGSDAISGVINIILKKDAPSNVSAQFGQNLEGDGRVLQADFSHSFRLSENGFLNLSGELRDRGFTNRSGRDERQLFSLVNGNPDPRENTINRINHRFGDAATLDGTFFFNLSQPISESFAVYSFGGFGYRRGEATGFFRPSQDDRVARSRDANGNIVALHPDGFLPMIRSNIYDMSAAAGLEGRLGSWDLNVGVVHGRNYFDFNVVNSNNASLGAIVSPQDAPILGLPVGAPTPTSAYCGTISFFQTTVNADAHTQLFWGLAAPLNLSLGAEYRNDQYGIREGEPASYMRGRGPDTLVLRANGTRGGLAAAGIQVFPGFQPVDAKQIGRNSVALYVEAEQNFTESFLLNLAGRFENFSDFGSTINGKAAFRFEFLKGYAIRGSVSTGFRAPSMQQIGFSTVSTNFIGGVPFEIKTFTVDDPVARALGAKPLKPERTLNFAGGLTLDPAPNFSLTADYYHITVTDRIVLSGNFIGDAIRNFLAQRGFSGVGGGRFFTNAIDTRTQGVDVVARYVQDLGQYGVLRFTVGFNYTQNQIININTPTPPELGNLNETLIDRIERFRIERGQPQTNLNLMLNYNYGDFALMLRTVRFGEIAAPAFGQLPEINPTITINNVIYPDITVFDQTFGARWITDIDLSYRFFDRLTVAVGGTNIFNIYPDRTILIPNNANSGRILPFSGASPFGFNGAHFYSRISYAL